MDHYKHFAPHLSVKQLENIVHSSLDKSRCLEDYLLNRITSCANPTKHGSYSKELRKHYYTQRSNYLTLYKQLTKQGL